MHICFHHLIQSISCPIIIKIMMMLIVLNLSINKWALLIRELIYDAQFLGIELFKHFCEKNKHKFWKMSHIETKSRFLSIIALCSFKMQICLILFLHYLENEASEQLQNEFIASPNAKIYVFPLSHIAQLFHFLSHPRFHPFFSRYRADDWNSIKRKMGSSGYTW